MLMVKEVPQLPGYFSKQQPELASVHPEVRNHMAIKLYSVFVGMIWIQRPKDCSIFMDI
jgi:hypothetical protein